MKNLIGYFQYSIHDSVRFSIYRFCNGEYGTGFIVGNETWLMPISFGELFTIGEHEYYESDS